MAGDIKLKYPAASTAVTVTNLQTLAASSTLIAGWTSNSVDNKTSNVYFDYLYGFTFTSAATNRQAGQINVYVIASLNDTPTFPAVSSGTLGTEGTAAFADTYRRDSLVRPIFSINVDSTASAIYTLPQTGIAQFFGGVCPTHHCIFITQNIATSTNAGFSSAAVYYTPVTNQYT